MNEQQHGGLGELPAAVGPSDQQQLELNVTWNTYHEIEERLMNAGIFPTAAPLATIPSITPEILNGLSGSQYMEVYAAIDAWHNYIGETISQLENIILQINNELGDLETHVRETMLADARARGDKKPAETEIKHTISILPRIRWLKVEQQKNQQHLNRLEARQRSLGRMEKLMSRNIERVKATMESAGGYGGIQRRASNMGGR